MADKSLIRGAALIGASKRSTWGEAMQKGLAQGFAAARIASQNRKAEKAAINSKVAGYIDSLNSNVDLTSLSASQQQAVANYLTEEKMRYADAATRIAKIDPDNPEYMELRDEMNGVKMSFQNLANNLNQYKQDKQAYLEDFDKGLLSDGNEISSLKDASDIYTDGGYAGVGRGGSLVFWDDNSKEYKNYSEMQKPFLKDFSAADKIIQLNESVYNAGSVLSGARENMIRQKLNNMISQGGRQTLLSLASGESAFVAHPKVAEAAVVGYPHDIKGNCLYCYVTLNIGERENGDLERDLKLWVRKQIGPLATPDLIHFTPGLPKTRSGKIMRRILRKIAHNEHGQLGDTTTLADPSVVDSLVNNRKNI